MTMVKTAIALLIAAVTLVACLPASTPTPKPTPTPYVPQYTSTEVIGIVHNKMIRECGARSHLGYFRDGYSASPRYRYEQSSTVFRGGSSYNPFLGVWDVEWRLIVGDSVVSLLRWQFTEDSELVAQLSSNLGRYCNR